MLLLSATQVFQEQHSLCCRVYHLLKQDLIFLERLRDAFRQENLAVVIETGNSFQAVLRCDLPQVSDFVGLVDLQRTELLRWQEIHQKSNFVELCNIHCDENDCEFLMRKAASLPLIYSYPLHQQGKGGRLSAPIGARRIGGGKTLNGRRLLFYNLFILHLRKFNTVIYSTGIVHVQLTIVY